MKKIISLAIMVIALAACTGSKVENGCWVSDEYKIYNVIPSYYYLDINGDAVTQSVFLKDPNDADNTLFTIWEGKVTERTESERGIEILVKYDNVMHYRRDTVFEPQNVSADEKEALYRIANDTLYSTRMPVAFTKCRKSEIPSADEFLAGKVNK